MFPLQNQITISYYLFDNTHYHAQAKQRQKNISGLINIIRLAEGLALEYNV